jgi:hypothetical protein
MTEGESKRTERVAFGLQAVTQLTARAGDPTRIAEGYLMLHLGRTLETAGVLPWEVVVGFEKPQTSYGPARLDERS